MPTEVLKYYKNEGVIRIEIEIKNTPVWSYEYWEDQIHTNSNNLGKPLRHTIGEPHELKKAHHIWEFEVVNPASVDIKVDFKIDWYQLVKGQDKLIHSWNKINITVKAEGGESIDDKIILFPIN